MPKLPADLPENWTRGQLVSPNGTEVGLTEKHGYNYLMKQVNNTQTEVNNINTALTDVAQEATVAEVLTKVTGIDGKIGTSGDTAGTETLFGQVKDISEKVPTGAVKSVQRGVSSLPSSSSQSERKITISTINPNKSFVLLTSDAANGSDKSYGQGVRLKELAAEYLVVDSVYREPMPFSWQVIECF